MSTAQQLPFYNARWIGGPLEGGPRTPAPCPFLRKDFELHGSIETATLCVSALGLYEARINGKKVGRHVLTPGFTDYKKRIPYQSYDVTHMLQSGHNALGLILGDGWYCGFAGFFGRRQLCGDKPWGLLLLTVILGSGQTIQWVSDDTWKVAYGPILESDMLMGESYDARKELTGWDLPDYDDASWGPVEIHEGETGRLVLHNHAQASNKEMIRPVGEPRNTGGWDRRRIYDLGQNMVGVARLRVKGPRGHTVVLRHAEMLENENTLHNNLRTARAMDSYTLKGEGEEVYEPRFTFHGFQYVEVFTPMKQEVEILGLEGVVRYSDIEQTGTFKCSNEKLNRLQNNIVWSMKGNFLNIPTDCPQRDERMGWTGDAQVFCPTAAYNRDVKDFFDKWLDDLADAQGEDGCVPMWAPLLAQEPNDGGPAWADAYLICAWTMYKVYGDKAVLERHYDNLKQFMEFQIDSSKDGLRCYEGYEGYRGFGDWLALDGAEGARGLTPCEVIGTAYFAKDARLMAEIANALGKEKDAATYRDLCANIREAFNREFVSDDGAVKGDTQTAHALALSFGLLDEDRARKCVNRLVKKIEDNGNRLTTGFVGTPELMTALTRYGRIDVAFQLLFQEEFPSWLFEVNQGATTIWERWDSWTKDRGFNPDGMNSFNHYAYGAVGDWMYRNIAGIDQMPDSIGYEKLLIRPRPTEKLDWARGALKTVRGTVETEWKREGGKLTIHIVVPAGPDAILVLPTQDAAAVTENGKPLTDNEGLTAIDSIDATGDLTLHAQPGNYELQIRIKS